MPTPAANELYEAIKIATRLAVGHLFKEYPETFYYCALITTGEGHCPIISAWSEEALERTSKDVSEREKLELKWSYADSPYFAYGEEYFNDVKKMFELRSSTNADSEHEFLVRINAMEQAMAQLDEEGLFGEGEARTRIVINAEVMPPDYGNTERAMRLNPADALIEWLDEVAEE